MINFEKIEVVNRLNRCDLLCERAPVSGAAAVVVPPGHTRVEDSRLVGKHSVLDVDIVGLTCPRLFDSTA